MYQQKQCFSQNTAPSYMTFERVLKFRNEVLDGHSDRLQDLVRQTAEAIGLPDGSITDLCLLAQYHDIGKVYLPRRILLKPGPLNSEEVEKIRLHCEFGYRIALSTPVLSPIAENILKHHEWWNGDGYPLGLSEGEIPLECRILAISDAYDAMTNDRPYRKAMSHGEAVDELRKYSGVQFDPDLADVFINAMYRNY